MTEEAAMATATIPRRMTYDDLVRLPQEREGDRHELIDGVLYVTASPVPGHQIVSGNTYSVFDAVVRPRKLGLVLMAPVDVYVAPTEVAVPALVYVKRERLGIVGPKRIEGAPDLIVEILSPSTRGRDLRLKKALYERFGVPEYWVIDHRKRAVTLHVLVEGRYESLTLTEGGIIRSSVVAELEVEVGALFAGL